MARHQTAIVTGASGFLGRQVVRAFRLDDEWTVKGIGLSRADGKEILKVDLGDAAAVERVLDEYR